MDNITDIKVISLSDSEFVDRLLLDDAETWAYLCSDVIAPMTKITKYTEMFYRYSIPLESIIGQVYLDLREGDFRRLRNYRFEGPFRAWLFFQIKDSVKRIFHDYVGKNPPILSEDEEILSLIDQTESPSTPVYSKENREVANYCLEQLWKENPMRAYIIMFRAQNGLSSRDVAEMLNVSSNNVDQIYGRARASMKTFKKEVD